jgi:hypothetical protein
MNANQKRRDHFIKWTHFLSPLFAIGEEKREKKIGEAQSRNKKRLCVPAQREIIIISPIEEPHPP